MTSIQPITRTQHGSKKWKRYDSYAFASQDSVAPLTVQELPKASKVLPICFMKVDDSYLPAALQSLTPGLNLFVAPDGKWMAPYVPAAYRGYPFVLGMNDQGESLLCADMNSGLIGNEGEEIFEQNEPSQAIKEVLGFLQAVQQNRETTRRACEALAKHGLIREWPLKVKAGQGEQPVQGAYQIDEQALNQLPADALAEVRDAGGLAVAYCQLLSMQNLPILQQLAKAHAEAQQAPATSSLDEVFGQNKDTISFNFDAI